MRIFALNVGINLVIVPHIIYRVFMLDLSLNSEEPHNMLIALGESAETPCCCTSVLAGVTFQQDPIIEDVYLINSTGSEVWNADENHAVHTEINGSFRKNVDGDVLFSGVYECACINEDVSPVYNVIHVNDVVVVESDDNVVRVYDDKNDFYIEIV
ncbi:hypothetical protein [Candidatus Anaplasma sp. TIGMIC]|uniref:hypothetical protein n=1 Tax=Candidatus Anaplasma sp. TIGMIC TaxID=3020713 RepID=UPI00232BB030|nr:hypothetical protein [Candidatus Anaplasma sp. TIGMIC]MDB1135682.1 hypothetical protein [Candidatus Anaplasma sp. TIGMIC]